MNNTIFFMRFFGSIFIENHLVQNEQKKLQTDIFRISYFSNLE